VEENDMEQLNPENALSIQHNEWLKHPVTRQMLQILDMHKRMLVSTMTVKTYNMEVDTLYFRLVSANIATINSIETYISNTNQFINQLNKK
jgi:trans-aconitate methyltransferase